MSLINPVSKHLESGDKVTARARPQRISPRTAIRERLVAPGRRQEVPEQVISALAVLQGMNQKLLEGLERLADSPALWSGTRQITSSGDSWLDFDAEYRSFHVANLSTHAMTVLVGPANDLTNPQQIGPGTFPVASGHFITMPGIGNRLSVIGTAGDLFRIAVYGITMPPATGAV